MKKLTLLIAILFALCLQGQKKYKVNKDFKVREDTFFLSQFKIPYSNVNYFPFFNGDLPHDTIVIKTYDGEPLKINLQGLVYFNPAIQLNFQSENHVKNINQIPPSFRYYLNKATLYSEGYSGDMFSNSVSDIPIDHFYAPFYMKQTEVTNSDYREFVHYVRDSVVKMYLGEPFVKKINGKTLINAEVEIPWEYRSFVLENDKLFLDEGDERFYRRPIFNNELLNIKYKGELINIYPDTLSWVNDFSWSWNEPMAQMYFWHPVYDDYPVVGVSYKQAKAFCEWKQNELRKTLPQIEGYNWVVDLPTIIEWDFVVRKSDFHRSSDFENWELIDHIVANDNSFLMDLKFSEKVDIDTLSWNHSHDDFLNFKFLIVDTVIFPHTRKEVDVFLNDKRKTGGRGNSFVQDGGLHTMNVRLFDYNTREDKKYQKNKTSMFGLGGNVSEWLLEDYSNNWANLNKARQEAFKNATRLDSRLKSEVEEMYNASTDTNGYLVVGGNWYDEVFGVTFNYNVKGAFKKNFLDPNKAHSTVGFRYVVKLVPNEESKNYFPTYDYEVTEVDSFVKELQKDSLKVQLVYNNLRKNELDKIRIFFPEEVNEEHSNSNNVAPKYSKLKAFLKKSSRSNIFLKIDNRILEFKIRKPRNDYMLLVRVDH